MRGEARRRLQRKLRRRRAVAGFFEEIPVMLVATISFLLTLAAIEDEFQTLQIDQQDQVLVADAQGLLNDLLTYANLTYLGDAGVFQASEVVNLTVANLSWQFDPGFPFQVTVHDGASEGPYYDRTVETEPVPSTATGLHTGVYRASAPVVLRVSDLVDHPGTVEVTAWQ